jgi:hypothetical protein
MPVKSIMVADAPVDRAPSLIFVRYFDRSSRASQAEFESEVLVRSAGYLSRYSEAMYCLTTGAGKGSCVTLQRLGQLVVIAAGTDEMDEIVLADVVTCVRNVILTLVGPRGSSSAGDGDGDRGSHAVDRGALKAGHLNDHDVLNASVYGSLALAVDELIAGEGHLDSTDVESLLLRAKLKA